MSAAESHHFSDPQFSLPRRARAISSTRSRSESRLTAARESANVKTESTDSFTHRNLSAAEWTRRVSECSAFQKVLECYGRVIRGNAVRTGTPDIKPAIATSEWFRTDARALTSGSSPAAFLRRPRIHVRPRRWTHCTSSLALRIGDTAAPFSSTEKPRCEERRKLFDEVEHLNCSPP